MTVLYGVTCTFAMNAFLVDHIRFFQERGLQVFMMVPPSDVAPSAEFGADRLISVSIQRNISILSDLLGVYRLWRVMRRVRPSITNMTTPKMGLLGGIAGLLARVPYRVYTLRGYRFETSRGLKRLVLLAAEWAACRCAHTVILISRSVEVDGIRLGLFEPGKGRLLGETMSEGLDLAKFSKSKSTAAEARDLRAKLGIPEAAQLIGFVGRLSRDKGTCELLEAWGQVRSTHCGAWLLLVGPWEENDPPPDWVRRAIATDERVVWTGYVDDTHLYYHAMDLFVFPTHREGLGKVVLEAAAAELPIIATRATGVIDIVEDGCNGRLVPIGESTELADTIRELLDNPHVAGTLARQAREYVERMPDKDDFLHALLTLYQTTGASTTRAGSSVAGAASTVELSVGDK